MSAYGDSIIVDLDVPPQEVHEILLDQAGRTLIRLLDEGSLSVSNFEYLDVLCDGFCDHAPITQKPHRIAGWKADVS